MYLWRNSWYRVFIVRKNNRLHILLYKVLEMKTLKLTAVDMF
ncbi:hypothetical protein HMPREF9549_00516 [Escherichia coli MS 185-1]|nr:hypothetical protein HMPREF9549_00516 [Escherichia coli MS 185-1]